MRFLRPSKLPEDSHLESGFSRPPKSAKTSESSHICLVSRIFAKSDSRTSVPQKDSNFDSALYILRAFLRSRDATGCHLKLRGLPSVNRRTIPGSPSNSSSFPPYSGQSRTIPVMVTHEVARHTNEGALLEASLKWDRAKAWPGRGNPNRPDAAPGVVPRKHGLGRLWVSVRPERVCHRSWLDGDRWVARNRR